MFTPTTTQEKVLTPTIQVNQPKLDTIPLNKKFVGVRSCKGTGKTYAITGVLDKLPRDCRKVLIGHRIALMAEAARRHRVMCYRDDQGDIRDSIELNQTTSIALCVNSLFRLKLGDWKETEVLIIDEAAQFIGHLYSDICKNHLEGLLKRLQFLLKNSNHIILADADLTDDTIQWYCDLAELPYTEETVDVIENNFAPKAPTYIEARSREALLSMASIHLQNGYNVMFHCSSIGLAKVVYRYLGLTGGAGFLLHGENSNTTEAQNFVTNINTEIEKYNFVVTTSSLGTGVSIDSKHIEYVYLLASRGCPIGEEELHQMFHRVRHPKARFFCIEGQRVSGDELDEERVREALITKAIAGKHINTVINEEGNEVPDLRDPLVKHQLKHQPKYIVQKNRSLIALRPRFIEYIEQENPEHVIETVPNWGVWSNIKPTLSGLAQFQDVHEERSIVQAPDYSDEDIKNLLRTVSGRLTKNQEAGLIKYRMRKFYDKEELGCANFDHWDKGKAEQRFEGFIETFWTPSQTLNRTDEEELQDPDRGDINRNHFRQKRRLRRAVIERAFGNPVTKALVGELYVTKQRLEDNGFSEWFKGNRKALKTFLGVTATTPLGALEQVVKQVGLEFEKHQSKERGGLVMPAGLGTKNLKDNTLKQDLSPVISVKRDERYYSIGGWSGQLERAKRLYPRTYKPCSWF